VFPVTAESRTLSRRTCTIVVVLAESHSDRISLPTTCAYRWFTIDTPGCVTGADETVPSDDVELPERPRRGGQQDDDGEHLASKGLLEPVAHDRPDRPHDVSPPTASR